MIVFLKTMVRNEFELNQHLQEIQFLHSQTDLRVASDQKAQKRKRVSQIELDIH